MGHGGKREGSGRPKKIEEQKIVEKLKPFEPQALAILGKNIDKGEKWAVELFFKYFYGMPKQQTDVTSNGESINKPFIIIGESSESNEDNG